MVFCSGPHLLKIEVSLRMENVANYSANEVMVNGRESEPINLLNQHHHFTKYNKTRCTKILIYNTKGMSKSCLNLSVYQSSIEKPILQENFPICLIYYNVYHLTLIAAMVKP